MRRSKASSLFSLDASPRLALLPPPPVLEQVKPRLLSPACLPRPPARPPAYVLGLPPPPPFARRPLRCLIRCRSSKRGSVAPRPDAPPRSSPQPPRSFSLSLSFPFPLRAAACPAPGSSSPHLTLFLVSLGRLVPRRPPLAAWPVSSWGRGPGVHKYIIFPAVVFSFSTCLSSHWPVPVPRSLLLLPRQTRWTAWDRSTIGDLLCRLCLGGRLSGGSSREALDAACCWSLRCA